MHTIWKDNQKTENFNKEGYLLLNLLSEDDLGKIREIYNQYTFDFKDTFYSSSFIPEANIRNEISKKLCDIIEPKVKHLIQDYKKLGAVFLIKPPHQNSVMPIHQDWTAVDEDQFQSITFWIPIQDTTPQNGTIKVLPQSHRLSNSLRSPTLQNPISDIISLAEPLMQALEMRAGQAFVFTHAILHSSFVNQSDSPRIAIAFGVTHKDANLIMYHKEKDSQTIEKLLLPEDFFISYPDPGKRPQGSQLIETVEYDEKKVSEKEFKEYFGIKEPKSGVIEKLKAWLKV